ncbi:SLED domain-containing protein [Ditylenchus destructor]|nr:SLED domain-containing protein [Ditylenchus destructor]
MMRDRSSSNSDDLGTLFLKQRAGLPAISAFLFNHERYLDQTLAYHLYKPGREVKVFCPLEGYIFPEGQFDLAAGIATNGLHVRELKAKMEMVVGKEALVQFSRDNLEASALAGSHTVFVQLSQIWPPEDSLKICSLDTKLRDLIKPGLFFELREANSLKIHVVKILEVRGGFVKSENRHGETETVHISSERCHPLGWTEEQTPKGILYDFDPGLDQPKNGVPAPVFGYCPVEEHRFKIGMIMEVLDPITRMMFYPAMVTKVHNQHYFSVRAIADVQPDAKLSDSPKIEWCHSRARDIYPIGWCMKQGLRLTIPKGMCEQDFSYPNLWKRLGDKLDQLEIQHRDKLIIALDDMFQIPKTVKKTDKMRYCEVYNQKTGGFVPAAIVRTKKHLVWVHAEDSEKFVPPKIYSDRALELFPWGYAGKHNFPIDMTRKAQLLSRVRPQININHSFTNQRSTIFRDNKNKKFMSDVWTKGDLWLHQIYVRKECFAGPFLNSEKVKSLPPHYRAGPLPLVMSLMIKNVFHCANRRTQLIEILSADKLSKMPQMKIKLRNSEIQRCRVNVEVCEQVSEFAGWLRMFLTQLDACPNLFSLDKRDVCPYYCTQVATLPYMQLDGHVNTAYIAASSQTGSGQVPQQWVKPMTLAQLRGGSNTGRLRNYGSLDESPLNITVAESTPEKTMCKTECRTPPPAKLLSVSVTNGKAGNKRRVPKQISASSTSSCGQSTSPEPPRKRASSNTMPQNGQQNTAMSSGSESGSDSEDEAERQLRVQNQSQQQKDWAQRNISDQCEVSNNRSRPQSVSDLKPDLEALKNASQGTPPKQMLPQTVSTQFPSPSFYHVGFVASPQRNQQQPTSQYVQQIQGPARRQTISVPSQSATMFHQNWAMGPTTNISKSPDTRASSQLGYFKGPATRSSQNGSPTNAAGSSKQDPRAGYPSIDSNPMTWSYHDVSYWFKRAGYPELARKFVEEEVDGEAIMLFKQDSLTSLGLKLGPALKVHALIEELRKAEQQMNR